MVMATWRTGLEYVLFQTLCLANYVSSLKSWLHCRTPLHWTVALNSVGISLRMWHRLMTRDVAFSKTTLCNIAWLHNVARYLKKEIWGLTVPIIPQVNVSFARNCCQCIFSLSYNVIIWMLLNWINWYVWLWFRDILLCMRPTTHVWRSTSYWRCIMLLKYLSVSFLKNLSTLPLSSITYKVSCFFFQVIITNYLPLYSSSTARFYPLIESIEYIGVIKSNCYKLVIWF